MNTNRRLYLRLTFDLIFWITHVDAFQTTNLYAHERVKEVNFYSGITKIFDDYNRNNYKEVLLYRLYI